MNALNKLAINLAARNRKRVLRIGLSRNWLRCRSTVEQPPGMKAVPQFTIPSGIVGQPTCHTHPHLIQPGHLTSGITQMEYRERRETLVHKLVAESQNSHQSHIIVIPAARKQYMSDKIPYVFRQNSDFYYLTGCLEPSAILVMVKPAQTENFKTIMFVHDKDAHAELWEGPRTGCSAAAHLFAVDEANPVETFASFISKKTASSRPAVVWYHSESPANPDIHTSVRAALRDSHAALEDPQRALHFMRVYKSPAEIDLMKETCYIGSQSINMAMACTKPGVTEHQVNAVLEYTCRQAGVTEHQVNAVLEYTCRQAGAEHLAFPPVVAGGPRATHIHYIANNQALAADEMLLVDSGSQRWLYNSDISRTWPVSGKFSKHHRILYELVLSVQKRLIELLGEHRPALDQLFDSMCRLLGRQLQQEGILPKNIDGNELIGEGILPKNIDGNELIGKAYRLCPHHVSHYLGLDVHDAPLVRRNAPVAPHMVVTVEPGIYIRPDDKSLPVEFRGVGIRVEDDVLITDGDPVVLTDACVKEPDDVEAVVGKHAL